MIMYSKVDLYNVYTKLSKEDKYFQPGEHKYSAYEGLITRTMSHFTQEAIEIQTENMKQEELYASFRQAREYNDNFSEDNESISSQERYSMDREQADKNCNEEDDGWVDFVINQPKKKWRIYFIGLLQYQ